ncbi:MAG TPA: hypothetical protein VJ453_07465 [Terriglobales bacterium]|nr:hypothetical protein [Terriglobales bacterium]
MIHEQTKILVAAGKRERERFIGKEPIENHQVLSWVTFFCFQKNGTFPEQNVRTSIEHELDTFVMTLDWNNFGV